MKNLKVMSVAQLVNMANDRKIQLPENANKAEIIALIEKAQDAKSEKSAPAPKAEKEKAAKAAKEEVKLDIINITDAPVGSVVRYKSSKKPYIVAERNDKAEKPYALLVSKTQTYASTKKEFEVVRVVQGAGTLPEKFEDAELNEVLSLAKTVLAERSKVAETKSAKAEAVAAAPKVEKAKTEKAAPAKAAVSAEAQAKADMKAGKLKKTKKPHRNVRLFFYAVAVAVFWIRLYSATGSELTYYPQKLYVPRICVTAPSGIASPVG